MKVKAGYTFDARDDSGKNTILVTKHITQETISIHDIDGGFSLYLTREQTEKLQEKLFQILTK